MSPTYLGLATAVIGLGLGLLISAVQLIIQHCRLRAACRRIQTLLGQLERERYDARHDPLTGLANRRALWPQLETSLRDTSRPTTVAVIDLDKFKDINDAADHTFGDQILTDVASSLAALPVDLVARLGGDEFAVITHGTTEHAGRVIQTALRVITRTVQPPDGRPPIVLTATIGWATAHADEPARVLLRRADLANRHAKRHNLGIHP